MPLTRAGKRSTIATQLETINQPPFWTTIMTRNRRNIFAMTVLASLCLGAVPHAQASTNILGLESSLNLLSFGNFFGPSSDIQGQVAVGGNASIANYSINTATGYQALYGGTGLTVGGNLDFASGAIWGNTVVGGNLTTGNGASFAGNVQVAGNLNANNNWLSASAISYGGTASGLAQWQSPTPVQVAPGSVQTGVNFASEQQRLAILSQSFDALANSGTGSNPFGGTVVLDTKGAALAVFDLAGADVINNLRLDNLGANTTVILNVHGQTIDFGQHGYENFVAGHVLFNLPDATQITFASGVDASFLAPLASFSSAGGLINGQVVVANWSGSAQLNDAAFTGTIAAVPEPETYAMLLAGLGVVGLFARRRRVV
jgi:choice-of-anchor A domain-containing protein